MVTLIHEFIVHQAEQSPSDVALVHLDDKFTYHQLYAEVTSAANGLQHLGLGENERTAIYLPKLPETIFGLFGTALAGGVFVPVNPLLKPNQVAHILKDCNVRVLFTSANRLSLLAEVLAGCRDLRAVVLIGNYSDTLPFTLFSA
jgi:acyl-CoA synthetase (AMP-forming)/AMP-acid ligase II